MSNSPGLLDAQIDALVYELYDLKTDEINIIEAAANWHFLQKADVYWLSSKFEEISKALDLNSKGLETVSRALETISKPLETVSKPLEIVSKALEIVSKGSEIVSRALEIVSKGLEIVSEADFFILQSRAAIAKKK